MAEAMLAITSAFIQWHCFVARWLNPTKVRHVSASMWWYSCLHAMHAMHELPFSWEEVLNKLKWRTAVRWIMRHCAYAEDLLS